MAKKYIVYIDQHVTLCTMKYVMFSKLFRHPSDY